jgi:hypothetical protein
MVKDHYESLGFSVVSRDPDGSSLASLDLDNFSSLPTFIETIEG